MQYRNLSSLANKPVVYMCLQHRSLENTVGKHCEKLLLMSNLSFSHIFSNLLELSTILIKSKIVVCTLFVWNILNYVVWERINFTSCVQSFCEVKHWLYSHEVQSSIPRSGCHWPTHSTQPDWCSS